MENIVARLVDQSSMMMSMQSQQFINSPDFTSNYNENQSITNNTDFQDGGGNNGSFTKVYSFMFMTFTMMFSTIIASMVSTMVPTLMKMSNGFSSRVMQMSNYIGCTKPLYEILLESSISMSVYGRETITITPQKIAVLHYLKKHQHKYKDLYKLKEQDKGEYKYDDEGDSEWVSKQYYEINQNRPVIIYKKGRNYLQVKCDNDFLEKESNNNNGNGGVSSQKIFKLYIRSNYGMKPIHEFV